MALKRRAENLPELQDPQDAHANSAESKQQREAGDFQGFASLSHYLASGLLQILVCWEECTELGSSLANPP